MAVLRGPVIHFCKVFLSFFHTGIDYPFYGIVWHPEKAAFEWAPNKTTQHTQHAIEAGQYFANFFVSEARKNNNKFGSYEEELAWVIDNYYPIHSGLDLESKTPFNQIYVF